MHSAQRRRVSGTARHRVGPDGNVRRDRYRQQARRLLITVATASISRSGNRRLGQNRHRSGGHRRQFPRGGSASWRNTGNRGSRSSSPTATFPARMAVSDCEILHRAVPRGSSVRRHFHHRFLRAHHFAPLPGRQADAASGADGATAPGDFNRPIGIAVSGPSTVLHRHTFKQPDPEFRAAARVRRRGAAPR